MQKTREVFLTAVIALVLCLSIASFSMAQGNINFHEVRKIFLKGKSADPPDLRQTLKTALESVGFVVVDNSADADAVLSSTKVGVVDGARSSTSVFRFELISSAHNVEWKTEGYFASFPNNPELDRKNIEKVVHDLFDAWKKSAKKAGIRVENKIP